MSPERKISRRNFLKGSILTAIALVGECASKAKAGEIENPVITERLWQGDKELPLWFIGAWGDKDDNFVVSAVVNGEPVYKEKETGRDINELLYNRDFRSDTEEIIVPVVFQNPDNGKFYRLNLSLGSRDVIAKTGMINLKDGQFLEVSSNRESYDVYRGGPANYMVSKQELLSRLRTGEQVAFSLPTSKEALHGYLPSQVLEAIPEQVKKDGYFQKLEREAVTNNLVVIEAMQRSQDLPQLTIFSNQFFMCSD